LPTLAVFQLYCDSIVWNECYYVYIYFFFFLIKKLYTSKWAGKELSVAVSLGVAAISYGWLLTIYGVDWLVGSAITWVSVVEDSWLSIGAETCWLVTGV